MPAVRPVKAQAKLFVLTQLAGGTANGDEDTEYRMIREPPLFDGALQVTYASWNPGVAVTFRGADGVVTGVTRSEDAEAADGPSELVATTVNVYATPFASPVNEQLRLMV